MGARAEMLLDEHFDLGDEACMASEGEVEVDTTLHCFEPQFAEACGFSLC